MIDLILANQKDSPGYDRLSIVHDEDFVSDVRGVSFERGSMLRLVDGAGDTLDVIRVAPRIALQIERARTDGRYIEVEICRMAGWRPVPRELGRIKFIQATVLPRARNLARAAG